MTASVERAPRILRLGREIMARRARQIETAKGNEPEAVKRPFGHAVISAITEARLASNDPALTRAKVLDAAAHCLALLEQLEAEAETKA